MAAIDDSVPEGASGRPPSQYALVASYLLAHGGKTLFWTASDLYFVFYLNQVCGIAPALTGLVVGTSILFAAIADVFTGNLLRSIIRTPQQAGRLQLIGGIGSSLMLILFALTAFIDTSWRIPSAVGVLALLRLSYALIDVPQNALLSFAPWSKRELTALVTGRNIIGGLAKMLLALAFVPVMKSQPSFGAATRFLWLVGAIGAVMVGGVILLSAQLAVVKQRFAIADKGRNNSITIHLIRMVIASLMLTEFTQLEPYLASQVIEKVEAATTFLAAVSLGSVLCQPFWRWRAMNTQRSRLLWEIITTACLAAGCITMMSLNTLIGSSVTGALCGLVSGGTLFLLWTEFAASTDGSDAFRAFGRFTAAAKLGQGVAIMAIGYWLQRQISAGALIWGTPIRWLAGGSLIVGAVALVLVRSDRQTHDLNGEKTPV